MDERFNDEQPTQPIPFETLDQVSAKWRAAIAQQEQERDDEARTQRVGRVR